MFYPKKHIGGLFRVMCFLGSRPIISFHFWCHPSPKKKGFISFTGKLGKFGPRIGLQKKIPFLTLNVFGLLCIVTIVFFKKDLGPLKVKVVSMKGLKEPSKE